MVWGLSAQNDNDLTKSVHDLNKKICKRGKQDHKINKCSRGTVKTSSLSTLLKLPLPMENKPLQKLTIKPTTKIRKKVSRAWGRIIRYINP